MKLRSVSNIIGNGISCIHLLNSKYSKSYSLHYKYTYSACYTIFLNKKEKKIIVNEILVIR